MTPLSSRMALKNFKGPGFDRVRLIAALVVVAHHCTTYITSNISHDVLFHFSHGSIQFGLLAVNVFFALSGFLVVPSLIRTGDVVVFAVHRFLRIMPALLINVVATVFLIGPLLSDLPNRDYFANLQTYRYLNNLIFRNISTLPGVHFANGAVPVVNGSLWTLYFEVLSYIALAVLFLLGVFSRRRLSLAVFALVYIANAVFCYKPELAELGVSRLVVFNSLFVYFLTGAMINVFSSAVPYDGRVALILFIATLAFLPLGIGPLILPISVAYLVIYFGFSDVLGSRPFRSDYSYGIYLNHALVLTALIVLFPQLKHYFAALTLVTIAAVLIAFFSWHYVEKPSLRLKAQAANLVRRKLAQVWPFQPGKQAASVRQL